MFWSRCDGIQSLWWKAIVITILDLCFQASISVVAVHLTPAWVVLQLLPLAMTSIRIGRVIYVIAFLTYRLPPLFSGGRSWSRVGKKNRDSKEAARSYFEEFAEYSSTRSKATQEPWTNLAWYKTVVFCHGKYGRRVARYTHSTWTTNMNAWNPVRIYRPQTHENPFN
jgi:hypothetical protein